MIAVLDSDRIGKLLQLPASACRTAIRGEFHRRAPGAELVLLDRNLETVLRAAMDCAGDSGPLPDGLTDRDRLLSRAAHKYTISQREFILQRASGLARLVERLIPLMP